MQRCRGSQRTSSNLRSGWKGHGTGLMPTAKHSRARVHQQVPALCTGTPAMTRHPSVASSRAHIPKDQTDPPLPNMDQDGLIRQSALLAAKRSHKLLCHSLCPPNPNTPIILSLCPRKVQGEGETGEILENLFQIMNYPKYTI